MPSLKPQPKPNPRPKPNPKPNPNPDPNPNQVTFIGPTSPVMRVLGDKIGSNLVAQKAG